MTDIEKVIAERKTMTVRELFLEAKKEVGYKFNARGAKMWFISYPRYDIHTEEYVGHTMPLKRTSKDVEIYLREEYCGMTLKTFLAEEKAWIDEETDKAIRQMNIDDEAEHISDKIAREVKACDNNDDVFNLLPSVDELNDVDNEPVKAGKDITIDKKAIDEPTTDDALQNYFDSVTGKCTDEFNFTAQNGDKLTCVLDGVFINQNRIGKFIVSSWQWELFGVYETAEQVRKVIDLLREAIARGDKEFTFPTIEELKPPKKFRGTLYKTNFNGRRHVFVGRARHNKGVMPMIVG